MVAKITPKKSIFLIFGIYPYFEFLPWLWISNNQFFPVPCLFLPKAQKGIDKGKKSTRFWERCIIGWNYTWASKWTENRNWICVRALCQNQSKLLMQAADPPQSFDWKAKMLIFDRISLTALPNFYNESAKTFFCYISKSKRELSGRP